MVAGKFMCFIRRGLDIRFNHFMERFFIVAEALSRILCKVSMQPYPELPFLETLI